MSEPLAYFLTWTTYGSWLSGDPRGWVESGKFEIQEPDPERLSQARERMTEEKLILDPTQRQKVEEVIRAHCEIRRWLLHAVNARTNHVHVVVTARGVAPETVMSQFKAWCTSRLKEQTARKNWWTEHGSTEWINDEEHLHNAIQYVLERQ